MVDKIKLYKSAYLIFGEQPKNAVYYLTGKLNWYQLNQHANNPNTVSMIS